MIINKLCGTCSIGHNHPFVSFLHFNGEKVPVLLVWLVFCKYVVCI